MAYNVAVSANIESDFLTQAFKFVDSSHGMSMIALAMLDINHKNLEVTLVFDDKDTLENCAEQMTAVWHNCMSNKVLFRSIKKDGDFVPEFFGEKTSNIIGMPTSSNDYKNNKVIMDADMNDTHVYKFYRWIENNPRVLTLKYVN